MKWAQDTCQYNGNTHTIDNNRPCCWMLNICLKIVFVFALTWKWSKVFKQTIYSWFSQYFHYWSTYVLNSNSLSFDFGWALRIQYPIFICCSVKNFSKIYIVFNPVFGTLSEIDFVLWFHLTSLSRSSMGKSFLKNERFFVVSKIFTIYN